MRDYACAACGAPLRRYPSRAADPERVFCSRACLGTYRSAHARGPKAARWGGGEKMDRRRVYWHIPWHPRADAKGYVPRAFIVAELRLGRPVARGEIVHHEDGDPTNDHPDNLTVLPSQSAHARLHNRLRGKRGAA